MTEAWDPFCYKYFGARPELLEKAHQLAHQLNTGKITYVEFIKSAAQMAGISPELAREFIDNNKPNLQLFAYIEQKLKPKYKIGMLSNAGENWLEEMFTSKQIGFFDDIVLSFKTGFIKPQEEIYHLAANNLGVLTEECVFIDDLAKHAEGAKQAGMTAILYSNFEQMKHDLEELLAAHS